jgi:hypothetical protein
VTEGERDRETKEIRRRREADEYDIGSDRTRERRDKGTTKGDWGAYKEGWQKEGRCVGERDARRSGKEERESPS